VFIKQLYNVLKPFSKFTKLILFKQLTITTATSIYFQLSKHLKLTSNLLQSHAIERPEDAMKARGLIGRNLG
jgi:hypothetical protein